MFGPQGKGGAEAFASAPAAPASLPLLLPPLSPLTTHLMPPPPLTFQTRFELGGCCCFDVDEENQLLMLQMAE